MMTKIKTRPRKGSTKTVSTDDYSRALYVEIGPKFYSDYEGPVYREIPLEIMEDTEELCTNSYTVGRKQGWTICCCSCHKSICFTKAEVKKKWTYDPMGCPLEIVPPVQPRYTGKCDKPVDTLYTPSGLKFGKRPRQCTGKDITLKLPHPRGGRTTVTRTIPKYGDCNGIDISGIFVKVGGQVFSDYEGLVYHRLPIEQCKKTKGSNTRINKLGVVYGTDGKKYKIGVRANEVICWRRNWQLKQEYKIWQTEPLGVPLWVKTCNDTDKNPATNTNDRLQKGKLQNKPKESEPDVKKKPGPDAVIVSEGKKYHVKYKGKVKGPNTKEGLYHKKTKPEDSKKRLEKALLAWAVLAVLLPVCACNITQWNLADQYSHNNIHRAMFERKINRSIHGIWPQQICKGIPRPMITDAQAKQIYGMMDASPKTNYTCCQLQRHEWNKHGWCNWFNVQPWVETMNYFNKRIQHQIGQECAVTCRYNQTSQLNIVLQARSTPTATTGCKQRAPYSFAGVVRKTKCKLPVEVEELLESMDLTDPDVDTWQETIVDSVTHYAELNRNVMEEVVEKLSSALERAQKRIRKLKKFFSSAYMTQETMKKVYCDTYQVFGQYIRVNNCLPLGLPSGSRFIAKNLISTDSYRDSRLIPKLGHHLDAAIILSLVALSDFAPETASFIYLGCHYFIPSTRHRGISTEGLAVAINLTRTERPEDVIPTSIYVAGEWVCVKPSWWPYSAEIGLFFSGAVELIEMITWGLHELLTIWNEATAVAFLCFLIKAIRGNLTQGLIILVLLSSTEARYNKRPIHRPVWEILKTRQLKGVLSGPQAVIQIDSTKTPGEDKIVLTDQYATTTFHKLGNTWSFSVTHYTTLTEFDYCVQVIGRIEFFCTMVGSPPQTNMVRPYEMKCLCGRLHYQSQTGKNVLTAKKTLESKCINRWIGKITCVCREVNMTFLHNYIEQRESKGCPGTLLVDGKYKNKCTYGSGTNCIEPKPMYLQQNQYSKIKTCFWCSYEFKNGNFSPLTGPLGWCSIDNKEYKLTKRRACNLDGVQIGTGEIECTIGQTTVKTKNINVSLIAPMPCWPITVNSQGPPSPKSCTYKFAKTHKNKFYDIKDEFWGQYMLKDEYQYWFDLKSSDHYIGGVVKYLPLVMVVLLGGKLAAWLLTAYYLITTVESAQINTVNNITMLLSPILAIDLESVLVVTIILSLVKDLQSRSLVIGAYSVIKGKILVPTMLIIAWLAEKAMAQTHMKQVEEEKTVVTLVVSYCVMSATIHEDVGGLVALIVMGIAWVTQSFSTDLTIYLILAWVLLSVLLYLLLRKRKEKVYIGPLLCLLISTQLATITTRIFQIASTIVMRLGPVSVDYLYIFSLAYIFYLAYLCAHGGVETDFFSVILDSILLAKVILVMSLDCTSYFISNVCSEVVRFKIISRGIEPDLPEGNYNLDIEKLEATKNYVRPYSKKKPLSELRDIVYIIARSILLTAMGKFWYPFIMIDLFLSIFLSAHKTVLKEVTASKNSLAIIVASLAQVTMIIKNPLLTKFEKMAQTMTVIRREILKHEVQNPIIREWYYDKESIHRRVQAFIVKVLGKENAIFCQNCEGTNIFPCRLCGAQEPRIRCGWTLKDLELTKLSSTEKTPGSERRYKPTNIQFDWQGVPIQLKMFIQKLPILATRQNLILVGTLGYEVETLKQAGWVLRGPTFIPKIVETMEAENSVWQKLQLFFGKTPCGSTPRNPTRVPQCLMKIRRGFEHGWAYSHAGGISSVEHVTGKNSIFISDPAGQGSFRVVTSNSKTDETEYGVKTDLATTEGARCIVYNPEAPSISGTKGAVVHLRKCGSEFKCVTVDGTPAYYNLNNLKGWSGLPIFDMSTGKIVGRVKAGVNLDSATEIVGGTTTVTPECCDLETIVSQLEKMERGIFKSVTLATGAGKTTELPRRLLERVGTHKRVLVLIPLRAAAISVHKYMQTKYPHINFNLRVGELKQGDMNTGITYASYGYMCQMEMPKVREMVATYSYIFLDEYHCATPEQLAIISKIHRVADKARVIAMTATPVGLVASKGQKFEIKEEELPEALRGENLGENYIELAGLKVKRTILKENTLMFVPTRKQAEEVSKKLKQEGYNSGFYYSGLEPKNIMDTTAREPYIVVATNAIESGITLPNLTNVIDTCLKCEKRVRIQNQSPCIITGLKKMAITPGEAAQRRGRVGRTKPGNYYRAPVPIQGEVDYHFNLLQAQLYGLPDGINITSQFRKMNTEWGLYEEDRVLLTQLEVCNNYLLSEELTQLTKNLLARTTHPEKIQIAYNCFETPVPYVFPEIKNGEVSNVYPDYNLISYKMLKDQPPYYFYATEEEDLAVDLQNMQWPAHNLEQTGETIKALEKMQKLSKTEAVLVGGLLGYIGYKSLEKRHKPFVETVYIYNIEKTEDTSLMQIMPDDIKVTEAEEADLCNNDFNKINEHFKVWVDKMVKFTQNTTMSTNIDKVDWIKNGRSFWTKLVEYLYKHESEITKYGGWGLHTALHNSISARLGNEVATAVVILKWLAFGGVEAADYARQAAVDVIVYYVINTPKYEGDDEAMNRGRRYVATVLASALAKYVYDNGTSDVHSLIEPIISYLPYASAMLQWFRPNQMESVIVTGNLVYKLFLSLKTGKNKSLVGMTISSGMELYTMNPISLCVSLVLGVGAIAAHTILEQSEGKRTLLMKLFVKNFLDQAATDELCKADPEVILSCIFELLHTAANPLRVVLQLYLHFYKKMAPEKILSMMSGKNILVLIVLECLEIMELDKESKLKTLSNNYLLDWLGKFVEKFVSTSKKCIKNFFLPAPFACNIYKQDDRVSVDLTNVVRAEHTCTCGATTIVFKRDTNWEVIQKKGSRWCRNYSKTNILRDMNLTEFFDTQNNIVEKTVVEKGLKWLQVRGQQILIDQENKAVVGCTSPTLTYKDISMIQKGSVEGWKVGDYTRGLFTDNGTMLERNEAYFSTGAIYFYPIDKVQACTRLMTIDNLNTIAQTINKKKLPLVPCPKDWLVTWYSESIVTDCHGVIRPCFGETVYCPGDLCHKTHQLGQNIDTETEVEEYFLAPDEFEVPLGRHKIAGHTIAVTHDPREAAAKLGYGQGEIPGNQIKPLTCEMIAVTDCIKKPTVALVGSVDRMSANSKFLLKTRYNIIQPIRLSELNSSKLKIFIGQEKLEGFDICTKYLTTKQLKKGKIKSETITLETYNQAKIKEVMIPPYHQEQEPVLVDEDRKGEMYHHIGCKERIFKYLKDKGYHKIAKTREGYMVKLSWQGESLLQRTIEPLIREQILKSPMKKLKNVHYKEPKIVAAGGWEPLECSTYLGMIPCKRKLSYTGLDAYKKLREMKTNQRNKTGYNNLDSKEWIKTKLTQAPSLQLKHLACIGKVEKGVYKEKYNYNIYNKKISAFMQDIGINLSKLPITRAQCGTNSLHEAIKQKIDKEPNQQNEDLHGELYDIFVYHADRSKHHTFKEVDWQTLEKGINRKGAAGFFEKNSIGEYLTIEGKKHIEQVIKEIKKGNLTKYYETAIPKNEKRDITEELLANEDIEKKPRVIQYPEARHRLAITKVLYQWVKQDPLVIPGYEGKTPLFTVFNKVYEEWKTFSKPAIVSFDTKAWDTQVTPGDLDLVARIQKWYYKKEYHKFIDTITEQMKETLVITEDGHVFLRKGQRGSGQPDTSAGNSILNSLTMIWAFCHANNVNPKNFFKLARIHVCGDDGFIITEEKLARKFSEEGPRLLEEAGKPQKLLTDNLMSMSTNFSDLEFCSHTPIKVRLNSGATTYMAGRDTSIILSKLATKLDETGFRSSEGYENQVAFCFLLMYPWNPLVRRICLYILSTTHVEKVNLDSPILYQYRGDPIGAFRDVYSFNIRDIERAEMTKLSSLNLNMTILGIWGKKTTQRALDRCIDLAIMGSPVTADRAVERKTGFIYAPNGGHVVQGKHYEKLHMPHSTTPVERYSEGPIKHILYKLKILFML